LAVRLTAYCAPAAIGSRIGTRRPTGSPIGTCSRIRRKSRAMAAAFRKPGGRIQPSRGRTVDRRGERKQVPGMSDYILRRLALMIPTLLGILFVSFVVVQFAPGGPVERVIAQLTGEDTSATSRISGGGSEVGRTAQPGMSMDGAASKYRGAQGLDEKFIKELERQFGFDKPAHERFLLMLWNFARFDFGKSYFRDAKVIDL